VSAPTRYAVYYLPAPVADWARCAARWLGRDIETGQTVPFPDVPDLPVPLNDISQSPRKYGLHATLKPPFRLAEGCAPDDLYDACFSLSAKLSPVILSGLQLARIGRFLALCPKEPCNQLNALAARCVRDLDRFRAPMDSTELDRRRGNGLAAAQEANLLQWGYPHVMDQFRFHITLTGRLPKAALPEIQGALDTCLSPLLPETLTISDIALVGEQDSGKFNLLRRFPLTG